MTCTQLDIAPTIASILDITIPDHDGQEIKEVFEYINGKKIEQILIVIIDGLGVTLFRKLDDNITNLNKLAKQGLFFECTSLPPHITTPNIGTILTGYTPEHHLLYNVADTFYTTVRSVLERASENGIKSGIVIESTGAKSLLNRVDIAIGVENIDGIRDYDRRIVDLTLKAFKFEKAKLLACHLRAIDNCAHHFAESWSDIQYAASTIDANIKRLTDGLETRTLMFITSDHPVHVERWAYLDSDSADVPLIVSY